jgi:hypothetical protein
VALKRPDIAVILVLVLVAVSASACVTSTNNSTSSGGNVLAAESTGGTWKPFVLNSSDALRSLAPPSQGSIQFKQDVNELKALQLNRTAKVNESINYWNNGSVVRWNEIARSLVVKNGTSAPMASRVYALLSVAQSHLSQRGTTNIRITERAHTTLIQVYSLLFRQLATLHTRLITPLSLEHLRQCSRTSILMKPCGSTNKQLQTTSQGFKLG